eukprot:Platyproteum_vivax@DN2859_c0_g1_i1.p2
MAVIKPLEEVLIEVWHQQAASVHVAGEKMKYAFLGEVLLSAKVLKEAMRGVSRISAPLKPSNHHTGILISQKRLPPAEAVLHDPALGSVVVELEWRRLQPVGVVTVNVVGGSNLLPVEGVSPSTTAYVFVSRGLQWQLRHETACVSLSRQPCWNSLVDVEVPVSRK